MSQVTLALKKQYVRVFNGKASWVKRIAATSFVIAAAPYTGYLLLDNGVVPSAAREGDIGHAQYASLEKRIDGLKATWDKSNQHYHALDRVTQDVAIHGNNLDYAVKMAREKRDYQQTHEKFTRDLQSFRDSVLISRGLSEQDAIALFEKLEQKTGAVMFPGRTEWRQEMAYLEECQTGAFQKSVSGNAKQPYSDIVLSCTYDSAMGSEGARQAGIVFGGIGGGALLLFLSMIGEGIRQGLPKDQRRADAEAAARDRRREEEKTGKKKITLRIEQ